MKYYQSYKGAYGDNYYYNGQYSGYSTPGMIPGTTEYYAANGEYIGQAINSTYGSHFYSVTGKRVDTYPGVVGTKNFYQDGEYIGSSYDSIVGETYSFFEDY